MHHQIKQQQQKKKPCIFNSVLIKNSKTHFLSLKRIIETFLDNRERFNMDTE